MNVSRATVLALSLLAIGACGGDKPPKAPEAQVDIDADPEALLPAQAIAYVRVDGRAFFASKSFGPEVAKIAEKASPLGEEVGFLPSRDLDAVWLGVYSTQGADVAAVLSGRFDEAKVKKLAETHTPTRGGAVLVASSYAGHDIYTVSNVGFTVLTARTALAGTETGMRRALDRIKDGRVKREVPAWIQTTLDTPGAVVALAADAAAQPGASDALRQIPFPWAQGVTKARVLADVKEPGANIAASLSYPDEGQAGQAATGLRNTAGLARLLALVGLQFREFTANADKADVQVKISVDDQSLRVLATSLPTWLGQR